MIHLPIIWVTCDGCPRSLNMTGWELKDEVELKLRNQGWVVNGEDTICPECAEKKNGSPRVQK